MGFFDLRRPGHCPRLPQRLDQGRQQTPAPWQSPRCHQEEVELPCNEVSACPQTQGSRRRPYFPEERGRLLVDLLREAEHLRRRQNSLACRLNRALTEPLGEDGN